jgi:hypothetical protein
MAMVCWWASGQSNDEKQTRKTYCPGSTNICLLTMSKWARSRHGTATAADTLPLPGTISLVKPASI